jgi:hypothetical protein
MNYDNVAAIRKPMRLPNGKIWRAGSTCLRAMGCSSIIRWVRPTALVGDADITRGGLLMRPTS